MSDYIGWFSSVALFLVSGQVRSIRASARGCNRGTERVVVHCTTRGCGQAAKAV